MITGQSSLFLVQSVDDDPTSEPQSEGRPFFYVTAHSNPGYCRTTTDTRYLHSSKIQDVFNLIHIKVYWDNGVQVRPSGTSRCADAEIDWT